MTRKQRAFVEAVREGLGLEEAAARAGYGVEYAQRLLEEPAIKAAIDAPDLPEPVSDRTPEDMLRRVALDPTQDDRVKIAAARALYVQEREKKPVLDTKPVIIDDISICEDCPGFHLRTDVLKATR